MPVLDIDENGRLKHMAAVIVASVMAHPGKKDEEARKQYVASQRAVEIVNFLKVAPSPPDPWASSIKQAAADLLPTIYASPSPDQIIQRAGRNARHAWIAGVTLHNLLAASIHHPEVEVNIDKVIATLGRKFNERPSPGPRPVTDAETVRKYWKKFRNVSHLHLVMRFLQSPVNKLTREDKGRIFYQALATLLAVAEQLRTEAVKRGFLKEAESWRVPESLNLVPVDDDIRWIIHPLPAARVESLRAYKPTHAKY